MACMKRYRKLQIASLSGAKLLVGWVFMCCLVDPSEGRTSGSSHGNLVFVILPVPIFQNVIWENQEYNEASFNCILM